MKSCPPPCLGPCRTSAIRAPTQMHGTTRQHRRSHTIVRAQR